MTDCDKNMSKGWRAIGIWMAAGCFLLPIIANADDFVVRDMRVEGLQRISEGTVFNYLPINIGDTIDRYRAWTPSSPQS